MSIQKEESDFAQEGKKECTRGWKLGGAALSPLHACYFRCLSLSLDVSAGSWSTWLGFLLSGARCLLAFQKLRIQPMLVWLRTGLSSPREAPQPQVPSSSSLGSGSQWESLDKPCYHKSQEAGSWFHLPASEITSGIAQSLKCHWSKV